MIRKVANHNHKFAQKYGIDTIPAQKMVNNLKQARIILQNHQSRIILGLNHILAVSDLDAGMKSYGTLNQDLFLGNQQSFHPEDSYTITYFSEAADRVNQSLSFAKKFKKSTYQSMLSEAASYYAKSKDENTGEMLKVVHEYRDEVKKAYAYSDDTYQLPLQKLKKLAKKVTRGLPSDYEKAKALEEYFSLHGFAYDLKYRPPKGREGVEYFVFHSKRGGCSSYATAMTLMCRAIGLPARYVEGYSMDEKDNEVSYVIRDTNSHAFTEVFISGYGWMTFDATVCDSDKADTAPGVGLVPFQKVKKLAMFCILVMVLFTLVRMVFPLLSEVSFRIRLKWTAVNQAVVLLYGHLKKKVEKKQRMKTGALTAQMFEDTIAQRYAIRISAITQAFEKVCYGGKMLSSEEFVHAYRTYLRLDKTMRKGKWNHF